ncbi:MAG: helix-turn-helix domain-containing protein [Deltaproteobacteria bacterium]|nr:helix-turn-helix domain-containing protein [Deltaproteobacteria bacterium]
MQTLSSSEAADFLGIKHATLYTYVSKGLLRSVHGEGPDRKARRYPLDDLRRLKLKAGGAEGTAYAATPGGARASVWHSGSHRAN